MKGFANTVLRLLRFPLLKLYDLLVGIRNGLYDRALLKISRLDKPVISIGNLSMGGAGKSPVTSALTDLLCKAGLKVAVLSRGYGRMEPETSRIAKPWGDWRLFGDEPVMIARRNPAARVCVGPTRLAAAQTVADWDPDVFLIDDGFQHRKLHRDLDVVLLDVTQPMPRRVSTHLFREHLPSLRRAHVVLLTRWDGVQNLSPWENAVRRINSDVIIQPVLFRPQAVHFLTDAEPVSCEYLKGRRVAAWSGIANPDKFFLSLQSLGAELVHSLALKDHEPLSPELRQRFIQESRDQGAELIITTEKDAVKLEKSPNFDIIMAFLSIETDWAGARPLGGKLEKLLHLL